MHNEKFKRPPDGFQTPPGSPIYRSRRAILVGELVILKTEQRRNLRRWLAEEIRRGSLTRSDAQFYIRDLDQRFESAKDWVDAANGDEAALPNIEAVMKRFHLLEAILVHPGRPLPGQSEVAS